MVALDHLDVTAVAESPDGDVTIGSFEVRNGAISGTDVRGLAYSGTATSTDSGVHVQVSVSMPAGTAVTLGEPPEEDVVHDLTFDLGEEHLASRATTDIHLPGFGEASVRFDLS